MLNAKVNLTQLCISKEIKHILESEEYQNNVVLGDPTYQQQIIKYALSNLSHRYMTLENITEIPRTAGEIFPACPIEERQEIKQLLQKKMSDIVRFLLERSPQEFPAHSVILEESR